MREDRPRHLRGAGGGGAEAGRAAALTCGKRRRPGPSSPAGWSSWRRRSRSPSPPAAAAAGRARPGPRPPARAAASRTARWRSQVTPAAPPPLGKGFLYGAAINQDGGRHTAAAILTEAPPYSADAVGRVGKGRGSLPVPLACLLGAAGRPPPDEPPGPPQPSRQRHLREGQGGLPPPGKGGGAQPAPYDTMVAPFCRNFPGRTCYGPLPPASCGTSGALTLGHAASPSPGPAAHPVPLPLPAPPLRTEKWRPPVRGGSRAAWRTVMSAAGSQPPRSPAASGAPIGWAPRSRLKPRRAVCVGEDGSGRSPRRGRRHGRRWVAGAAPSRAAAGARWLFAALGARGPACRPSEAYSFPGRPRPGRPGAARPPPAP